MAVLLLMIASFLIVLGPNMGQYQLSSISYLLIEEYQLSDAQYAQLFTSMMIPGAALSLISGVLCDRFGVLRCCGIALLISGACSALRFAAGSYGWLFFFTMCLGISVTFMNSNAAKLVAGHVEEPKRSKWLGIVLGAGPAGMFVGMATAAYLFKSVSSVYMSQTVLFAITIALWFAAVSMIRKGRAEGPLAAGQMKGAVETIRPAEEKVGLAAAERPGVIAGLKAAAGCGKVWLAGACMFFYNGANTSVSLFLPLALQEHGFTAELSSTITALMLLGTFLGFIFGAGIVEKFGKRKAAAMWIPLIISAGLVVLLVITKSTAVKMVLALAAGMCSNLGNSTLLSSPVRFREIGVGFAGTAGGMIASLQLLGSVLLASHVIAGLELSYDLKIICAAGSYIICGIFVFILTHRKGFFGPSGEVSNG